MPSLFDVYCKCNCTVYVFRLCTYCEENVIYIHILNGELFTVLFSTHTATVQV